MELEATGLILNLLNSILLLHRTPSYFLHHPIPKRSHLYCLYCFLFLWLGTCQRTILLLQCLQLPFLRDPPSISQTYQTLLRNLHHLCISQQFFLCPFQTRSSFLCFLAVSPVLLAYFFPLQTLHLLPRIPIPEKTGLLSSKAYLYSDFPIRADSLHLFHAHLFQLLQTFVF